MNATAHNVGEQLHGNDVHVWLGCPPEIRDPALLHAYHLLLNAEERQRQARFVFSGDRHSYLVAHALLRIVLSKYAPIQPQAWQFMTNDYGRPEIANHDPSARQINFNVSHAHGLAVVAVTRAPAVGVDVEEVRARPAPLELADRHFAPQEILALQALPAQRQSDRFYEFWTLKEAYIKARGLGLSIPLDQFRFQFEGERTVHFCAEPSLQGSAESWKFWQFCPSADHVLALCVRRGPPAEPRLLCRRFMPPDRDELLDLRAVRESA
jgi:4'-phosphopantetheinyl transferase